MTSEGIFVTFFAMGYSPNLNALEVAVSFSFKVSQTGTHWDEKVNSPKSTNSALADPRLVSWPVGASAGKPRVSSAF